MSVCLTSECISFVTGESILKQLEYALLISMGEILRGRRPFQLLPISLNLQVFYHKCCSLIGYATHYLFGER